MTQAVSDAGGTTTTTATGGSGGAPAPWTDAIADTELKDFAINKGYHKLAPNDALPVVVGQYRNLEKLMGADKAGRTVELPNWDQNDEAGLAARAAFNERIGVPKTPADYKLDIKIGDKSDAELANAFAGLLHKNGVPVRAAAELAKGYSEMRASQMETARIADQAKYAEQDKALKTEWGSKYEENMAMAKNAAKTFGMTAEQLDAMQNTTDYLTVMKVMTQIAGRLGEAEFIDGSPSGTDGKMTPAEAKAAVKSFIADPEVRKGLMDKYHPKHAEYMARKAQLTAWEVGQ